ncbi:hypothetical protein [Haloarchaeobius sp. DYHT-AS-18]|uniref:hypothetical protein n=1 Tax=Haloarchaeobius sp. DYHT-AS-18 TaxID=3446117 RepID=UPI003EB93DEC
MPDELEPAGFDDADLLVVGSRPQTSRRKILDAIEQGKPVAFVGNRSFDGLLATLYKVPRDDVGSELSDGRAADGLEMDYSIGFDYQPHAESAIAIVIPENGSLNTARMRGSEVDQEKVFSYLGAEFSAADESASASDSATSSDVSITSTTPYCPINLDNSNEWNCLGWNKVDPDSTNHYCPQGPYQRITWGVKLTNGSSANDYFGFETRVRITAGQADAVDCSSDQWETTQLDFSQTFNDGVVESYGPVTEPQSYSTTETIGFDISVSGDQIGAGANVQWSKTATSSGVKTDGDIGGAEQQVDYQFDIKPSGNVGGGTFTAWLGQRVRMDSGTDSTDFSYDERYKWVDRADHWWESDQYHTKKGYGTMYWSV